MNVPGADFALKHLLAPIVTGVVIGIVVFLVQEWRLGSPPNVDLTYSITLESLLAEQPTAPGALLTASVSDLAGDGDEPFRETLRRLMIEHITTTQEWAIIFTVRNVGNAPAEQVRTYAEAAAEGSIRDVSFTSGLAECRTTDGGDGAGFVRIECDRLEPANELQARLLVSVPALTTPQAEMLVGRVLDSRIGLEEAVRLVRDVAERLACTDASARISLFQGDVSLRASIVGLNLTRDRERVTAVLGRDGAVLLKRLDVSHGAVYRSAESLVSADAAQASGNQSDASPVVASLNLAVPDDISFDDILQAGYTVDFANAFDPVDRHIDVELFFPIDTRRSLEESCPLPSSRS